MKTATKWIKGCPTCKKEFRVTKHNYDQKFCSHKCGCIANTFRKIYKCPLCGRRKECHNKRYEWYVSHKSLCKQCHMEKMRKHKGPPSSKQKTVARALFEKQNPSYKKENRKKISNRMHTNNPVFDPEVRRKIRIAIIKDLKKKYGKICPNYNKKACFIIDQYGSIHGYNFKHALNGGEFYIKTLGYWVDGYDKNKNVVIEYYEKKHRQSIQKDENRKREIINFLNCKFIEIKEWNE